MNCQYTIDENSIKGSYLDNKFLFKTNLIPVFHINLHNKKPLSNFN